MSVALLSKTVVAAAELSAHRFVTVAGAVPAANGNAIGVTRAPATAGAPVAVDCVGIVDVEASAAISAGAALATTDDGRAVTYSTGAVVARALTAATGAGQHVSALLIPN